MSSTTRHIFDTTGGLIATVEGNGTATSTYYQHQDHLGGGNAVTNSSGTVVETTDYYPYGSQRIATGSFDEQRKFTGHEYDSEVDLTYANARYYEQDIGRWLSQDPMFLDVGENLERAGGDPQPRLPTRPRGDALSIANLLLDLVHRIQ